MSDEPQFPHYLFVHGVAAVAIPTAEYNRLKGTELQGTFESPLKALRELKRKALPRPSTIERDPEVASFLRERFARVDTIDMARRACIERFGDERTPSLGRIGAFRNKVRAGA